MDREEDGLAVRQFFYIKVKLDICKPLMRGFSLMAGEEDEPIWCPMVYEFLPELCYVCGIIGHTDKTCEARLADGEVPQFSKKLDLLIFPLESS